jgi:hypothetical protein
MTCLLGMVVLCPTNFALTDANKLFAFCCLLLPVLVIWGAPLIGIAMRGEPLLSIDGAGIHDRRLGFGTIAWDDVEGMEVIRDEVWLTVRGLERYRVAEPFLCRLSTALLRFVRSVWDRDRIAIRSRGTGLSPQRLRAVLRDSRPALPASPTPRGGAAKKSGPESGGDEAELVPGKG